MQVQSAGSKGNGAFAMRPIVQGTYLGDYEGELLDEKTYWQRYPNGVVRPYPECLSLAIA